MTETPNTRGDVLERIRSTPIEGDPEQMRSAFARLFAPAARVSRRSVGGVPCGVWEGGAPGTILWLHGGGLVLGSPETHAAAAVHVVRATERTILMPDYPLAPEHVWPAQMEATLAAFDAAPGPVHVVGDSVGGQLALLLAFARPGRIAGLTLISPNTDRTGASATRGRDSDEMNDDAGDAGFARMAFGDRPGGDVEVSPHLGPLHLLPPTSILACTDEILLDDSLILARAAGIAGAEVSLRLWRGLWHLWPLWPEALPEAREALDEVAAHAVRTMDDAGGRVA